MNTIAAVAKLPGQDAGADVQKGRISLVNYFLVLAQLSLLLLLLRQFQIESGAFLRLAMLAFAGFAVHALLPLRLRLPFFLLLGVVGIGVVLGVENAAWLIGIGLTLIGICHLPIPFVWRGMLLVGVAGVLALQRADYLDFPWSDAIWPILGAMFMFRLIVYFYDLRHDKSLTSSPTGTLAYFFMLPNACFPLFPVVDYKTFRRNYFDDDAYRIYQVGIEWMVRGVIHLILYRIVYYYLTLAPHEVNDPAQLNQYLVSNFLLYLRVSGLFHLIVGMLYLFGFRLPETHNRFLLASSFTDFWRRINIYWKDFMQKVFYYPAIFKLRQLGTEKALVIATLYVFLMTWFLHAYQWFWLRGTVLLVVQDILFWTILGLLVVANSLYEMKYGRKRSLGSPARTWRGFAVRVLKTYATFWFICVLWSFWTAESLNSWFALWNALGGHYTVEALLYPSLILAVIIIGSIPDDALRNIRGSAQSDRAWFKRRLVTLVSLVALIGVSVESVHSQLGQGFGTFVHSLRSGHLSRLDVAKLERGYYESLLSVDRFNSQLWEVYMNKPKNWLDVESANLKHFVGGFVQTELIPSFVQSTKFGTITINRFGMRDRDDYTRLPDPGTFRVAVLGASSVMGWGVDDDETFEHLLEARLNREWTDGPFDKYELLNMGVPGYQPTQQLSASEKAFQFGPNAIFYVAAGREISRAVAYLAEVVHKRIDIPYDGLRDIVLKAEVTTGMDEEEARRRLSPYSRDVLMYVYGRIVQESRDRGVQPVWIFMPQVREGNWQEETPETIAIAESAGFVLINLEDVYEGRDIAEIRLAEWDDHPNTLGHRLFAERLFVSLTDKRETIFQPTQR